MVAEGAKSQEAAANELRRPADDDAIELPGAMRWVGRRVSHTNNEGRVIKYLRTSSDPENPKDLPEHFNERHPRSLQFWLYMSKPFNGGETNTIV